jgi:hypothetical protein
MHPVGLQPTILAGERPQTYALDRATTGTGMNDNRILKKLLNTKLNGVRKVGRPKMRWEDCVDRDMRILQVKNWKKVALDRDE